MSPAPRRQTGKQAYGSRFRGRRPSSTDWLQILDIDGPFLAAPVITDTWPDGLPALDPEPMNALRAESVIYDNNVGARDGYIRHILTSTLDWRANLVWGPEATQYAVTVPEHQTTVDITFAMLGQDDQGTIQPDRPLLLGAVIAPGTSTTGRAPTGTGSWPASPADRLAHALRTREVPLGLVINGITWTLVTISAGGAVSTATWTRHGWLEEAETLRAFVAILDRKRFLGVGEKETLPGLLAASLARQEEVTERLSEQSQSVVEMLVATIGRADAHHKAETGLPLLPPEVTPAEVYQATVTILMRLVFLLYAEERGLLPLDDDTYATTYAVSTLAQDLRDRATEQGEDTLERTSVGWHRLLAVFRAVHRGVRHEQLLLPAYGGSLCDPDRFPWLEGRTSPDEPLGAQHVPAIDDRTLLRALDSLQTLQFAKERRQVSYRSLDVEQIGYVYEGLLEQSARRADEWVVSIAVSDRDLRKNGPELALADLEAHHQNGDEDLVTWLHEQTKNIGTARSKASILKALVPPAGDDLARHARLIREASGNDDVAAERLMPYCRLLRLDPRDLPVVYPPGSLYLTDSDARANTGAVYTPKFLAEQVVNGALEPLVYDPGPLDTEDKSAWKIKTPEQILALKVADIAAGSGAFLVAAARYLAGKLLEARLVHTPAPQFDATTEPNTDQVTQPRLALERTEQDELDARRAIIDHCIYGVDINPMAIEMAKLSLWLITLDRNRPFSFLDDRLAVGDSLLGVTHADQISNLHLDPKAGRRLHKDTLDLFVADTDRLLKEAAEIRQQIAEIDLRDTRDADHKARLLEQARTVTNRVALVADGLSAASLEGGSDGQYLALARKIADAQQHKDPDAQDLREYVSFRLTRPDGTQRRPAHFPLLFPEVFAAGRLGFDALIGNPPFLGNRHWRSAFGQDFQAWAAQHLNVGSVGKIDLALLFLRQAWTLLADDGAVGLIMTTSVREPESRELGYGWLAQHGASMFRAVSEMDWPTNSAGVHVSLVWISKATLQTRPELDGQSVSYISNGLTAQDEISKPVVLDWLFAFEGVHNGQGESFLLDAEDERLEAFIAEAPESWIPYLSGNDITNNLYPVPKRYCLYTGDRKLAQSLSIGPLTAAHLEGVVRPERTEEVLKPYPGVYDRWWQMCRTRGSLRERLRETSESCLAMPAVSKYSMACRMPSDWVATNKVRLIEDKGDWLYALLMSQWFEVWVWHFSGRYETRINLAVTGAIRTFPLLSLDEAWATEWLAAWHGSMSAATYKGEGLTDFWNRFHGPEDGGSIDLCRDLRRKLDVRLAVQNRLPQLDEDRHVEIAVGQRFGWDTDERMTAVVALNSMNASQGSKRGARKRTRAVAELRSPFGGVPTLFGGVPTLFGEDT